MKAGLRNPAWQVHFKTSVLAEGQAMRNRSKQRQPRKNLCSLRSLLFKSKRDGDSGFKFMACSAEARRRRASDTQTPCMDNRLPSIASTTEGPLLVGTKTELPEHKCAQVIRRSGLPSSAVSVALLSLEMKRVVRQLPGELFVKNR